jgi:hypothetical protein
VKAHIIRFLSYNFLGALFPVLISLIVHGLGKKEPTPGIYTPEFLFFAVVISATALGDITDEKKLVQNNPLVQLVKAMLLWGALSVAVIYGLYLYGAIIGPENQEVRNRVSCISPIIAVVLFLASLLAEIMLAKKLEQSGTTP